MNPMYRLMILAFALIANALGQIPDFTPQTPLLRAILVGDSPEAKRLLDAGANPNESSIIGAPGVLFPIMRNDQDLFRAMVAHGADVKALDMAGSSTLMWAAAMEGGDPTIAQELLRLGVDPKTTNKLNETALTWATRRGNNRIIALLNQAGVDNQAATKKAVEQAVALLQSSSPKFLKVSGCASCHHQFLPIMAYTKARQHGATVNEAAAHNDVMSVAAMIRPFQEELLKNKLRLPNPPITMSMALVAMADGGYPADDLTRVMIEVITQWQMADGGFHPFAARPPLEASAFTATALSLRALQLYGNNADGAVRRAADWLARSTPQTNEDRAMQVLGLTWAKADRAVIEVAAQALIAQQRPDGGWAQLPEIETDAYATGQAMVALVTSGVVKATDPIYQKGVHALLRTQHADGSWLVRSRTFRFQPLKESGFPHGLDQWISAAGTSWASMALSLALPEQPASATPQTMESRKATPATSAGGGTQ